MAKILTYDDLFNEQQTLTKWEEEQQATLAKQLEEKRAALAKKKEQIKSDPKAIDKLKDEFDAVLANALTILDKLKFLGIENTLADARFSDRLKLLKPSSSSGLTKGELPKLILNVLSQTEGKTKETILAEVNKTNPLITAQQLIQPLIAQAKKGTIKKDGDNYTKVATA